MERTNHTFEQMLFKLLTFTNVSPKHSTNKTWLAFHQSKLQHILKTARQIFIHEDSLLYLQSPIKVVGDLHGQFFDLLRLLEYGGFPPESSYLFLGNYVNGGNRGIEVFLLLALFKIKYPSNVYLLRGNHDSSIMCNNYGFFHEFSNKYSNTTYQAFIECFNALPIAAVVSNTIFCVHGGISPKIHKLSDILTITRPIVAPEEGPVCDLLWSDPSDNIFFWGQNLKRNAGCRFGVSALQAFLKENNLQLLCRSNEIVESGYQLSFRSRLITIFSAPNYLKYYNNTASFLSIKEDLQCVVMSLRARRTASSSSKKKKGEQKKEQEKRPDEKEIYEEEKKGEKEEEKQA